MAAMLAGCGLASAPPLAGVARAPDGQSTIVRFINNAEPAGWDARTDRIVLNRRGADGLWDAYTITPTGSDQRCLTRTRPSFAGVGAATNRGASDVSPDGRYVLLTVEKGRAPRRDRRRRHRARQRRRQRPMARDHRPRARLAAHRLPAGADQAVIWPRFDRTGTQIVWAQMTSTGSLSHPLGGWALKLARLDWQHGTPQLADTRTYAPQAGRFFEPYGFSPDDQRILFASDITIASGLLSDSAFNAQIWTINAAHLNHLKQVSPPAPLHGPFSDYNEFAYYIPHTDRILFARTIDSTAHGMDYWTVNPNGTDPRRLTFLNQPTSQQYEGYSITGGLAFDPRNPHRFIAGVSHDLASKHLQAQYITINPARNP